MRRKILIFVIAFAIGINPISSYAEGVEPDREIVDGGLVSDNELVVEKIETTETEIEASIEEEIIEPEVDIEKIESTVETVIEEESIEEKTDNNNNTDEEIIKVAEDETKGELGEENSEEPKGIEIKTNDPSGEVLNEDIKGTGELADELKEESEADLKTESQVDPEGGDTLELDENGCISIPMTLHATSENEEDVSSIRVPDVKIYLYAIPVEATYGEMSTANIEAYPTTSEMTKYENTKYLIGVSDYTVTGYKSENADAVFGDSGLALQNILMQVNEDAYEDGWYRYQLAIGNVALSQDDLLSAISVSDNLYINLDGGSQWLEEVGLPAGFIYIDIIKNSETGMKIYISTAQEDLAVNYAFAQEVILLRSALTVPTGINIIVFPFILMTILGGMLLLVFLHRRRVEGEE